MSKANWFQREEKMDKGKEKHPGKPSFVKKKVKYLHKSPISHYFAGQKKKRHRNGKEVKKNGKSKSNQH